VHGRLWLVQVKAAFPKASDDDLKKIAASFLPYSDVVRVFGEEFGPPTPDTSREMVRPGRRRLGP
jgi:hypothetical protein